MKRKELILHLLGELSSYILDGDPSRMNISLDQEDDGLHISVTDENSHGDRELIKIEELLNGRKRPELAAYYGEMAGHDLLGASRLNLLGWQVKSANVCRTETGIKIDLWVGAEAFNGHKKAGEASCQ